MQLHKLKFTPADIILIQKIFIQNFLYTQECKYFYIPKTHPIY